MGRSFRPEAVVCADVQDFPHEKLCICDAPPSRRCGYRVRPRRRCGHHHRASYGKCRAVHAERIVLARGPGAALRNGSEPNTGALLKPPGRTQFSRRSDLVLRGGARQRGDGSGSRWLWLAMALADLGTWSRRGPNIRRREGIEQASSTIGKALLLTTMVQINVVSNARERAVLRLGTRLDTGAREDGGGFSGLRTIRIWPRRGRASVHRQAYRPALQERVLIAYLVRRTPWPKRRWPARRC